MQCFHRNRIFIDIAVNGVAYFIEKHQFIRSLVTHLATYKYKCVLVITLMFELMNCFASNRSIFFLQLAFLIKNGKIFNE